LCLAFHSGHLGSGPWVRFGNTRISDRIELVAPSSPRTPRREDILRGAETVIKEAVIISDSMVPRGMLDTMVSKMHLLDIKGRKKLPYGVNEKGFIYLLALEIGNSRGLIDAKLSKILCWQRVCSGGGAVPSAFAM
jgi:hypothetical protein